MDSTEKTRLQSLRSRCLMASQRGYSVACADQYAAALTLMVGDVDLPDGTVEGSAAHLLALCDAALAGKKPAKVKSTSKSASKAVSKPVKVVAALPVLEPGVEETGLLDTSRLEDKIVPEVVIAEEVKLPEVLLEAEVKVDEVN